MVSRLLVPKQLYGVCCGMLIVRDNIQLATIVVAALRAIACLAATLILLGCSMSDITPAPKGFPALPEAQQTPLPNTPATVEVDVFSGRPNPRWSLSEEDTKNFRAMVAALPTSNIVTLSDPLGYRGIIVQLPGEAAGESTTTWRVWKGVVQQKNGTTESFYSDLDRKVEAWLLQRGQTHIEPEVFKIIQTEISSTTP